MGRRMAEGVRQPRDQRHVVHIGSLCVGQEFVLHAARQEALRVWQRALRERGGRHEDEFLPATETLPHGGGAEQVPGRCQRKPGRLEGTAPQAQERQVHHPRLIPAVAVHVRLDVPGRTRADGGVPPQVLHLHLAGVQERAGGQGSRKAKVPSQRKGEGERLQGGVPGTIHQGSRG